MRRVLKEPSAWVLIAFGAIVVGLTVHYDVFERQELGGVLFDLFVGAMVYLGLILMGMVVKDTEDKKKDDVEIHRPKEQKPDVGHMPLELQLYYQALAKKDREGMEKHLRANMESCPNRNSYCGSEVFCPDCPLSHGGLAVRSYRYNWE